MFVASRRTMEGRRRSYRLIRTKPLRSVCTTTVRGRWAGRVGQERLEWAERISPAPYDNPAHFPTTNDRKNLETLNQEVRTLMPTIPAPSQVQVSLCSTDKLGSLFTDFLIRCITQQIEYLHIYGKLNAPKKKALSASSVDLVREPAICHDWPESAKVLRHQHNNKLRMLTHRWKKLGLPDPVSTDGTDQTSERSRRKKQLAMKTDSLLKMYCPIQASQDGGPRENEQADGLQGLSSNSSRVRISEGKINDKPGSSECPSDSTLSDQEQESIETSKWAAAMKLKPESFAEDHLDHHSTGTAVYPDVLPAALPDSTQQSVDPCLASLITRLMELERLQAATVQKEKAKLARSRPATANTRCGHRLKKRDLPGCNARIPRDADCSSVMCSFTKLTVCPSSSCKCRHHTCSSTKPGRGTKTKSPHPTSPDGPDSMSSKSNTAETVLPIFSVNVKVPQKPTMPNRTKSSKSHGGSMSDRKAAVPNKKT